MLKNREVIIFQATSRIRKTSHKRGIEAPTSLNHAAEIDSKNKNIFLQDSIAKETSSIGIASDILETRQIA